MATAYPQAIAMPILGAIVFAIDLPPLWWHFRNGNVPACCLVLWITILNAMNVANPIIWPNDDMSRWWSGEGFCDVEVRLYVGSYVGMPAAILCVMRGLARVMDTRSITVRTSRAERRARCVRELVVCVGLPVLFMALYYVVQSDRYYITSVSGCLALCDRSWVSIVLILMWPTVLLLVSAYYAVLIILRLRRYRTDLSTILSASSTTRARFLRLFLLSALLVTGILPLQLAMLARNAASATQPYSWHRVHDYPAWSSRIVLLPSGGAATPDRWVGVGAGVAVFAFFGLGEDATGLYRAWAAAARKRLGGIAPAGMARWGEKLAASSSSLFSSVGRSRGGASASARAGEGEKEAKGKLDSSSSWAGSSIVSSTTATVC